MCARRQPRLERIGVGFDAKPQARVALELAAAIAVAAGAGLEVRRAVDDRLPGGLKTEQVVPGGDEKVAKKVRSLLNRALAAAKATGAQVRVDVTPGNPTNALRALGADVDLLVIGSSSSGPAGRVSFGKTGSTLLGGTSFPVLVAPKQNEAAAI
jgi:nucleotide-binding universal stress UspA family protein